MHAGKRLLYRAVVAAMRCYRDAFLKLHVFGRGNIPPGPKIYVTNHISSTDPYWILPEYPEPVHVVVGPGYSFAPARWLLDRFEQINAMPQHRKSVVDQAARYLARGEAVYNAPEGDLRPPFSLGQFYPGVARIYRRTRVPIIPIALAAPPAALLPFPRMDILVGDRKYRAVFVLWGPYAISIGEPLRPALNEGDESLDNERIMGEVRERIQQLLDQIRVDLGW